MDFEISGKIIGYETLPIKRSNKFNFNDYIKVELTEFGMEIMMDYYNKFHKICPEYFEKMTIDKIKEKYIKNGKSLFLLWEFMYIFGHEFYMGNQPVCKMDFEILRK